MKNRPAENRKDPIKMRAGYPQITARERESTRIRTMSWTEDQYSDSLWIQFMDVRCNPFSPREVCHVDVISYTCVVCVFSVTHCRPALKNNGL